MTAQQELEEFEDLAFTYMGPIYDRAVRLSQNTALADDLVQNTYSQAYYRFREYDHRTDFFTWLLDIFDTVQEEAFV